MKNTILKLKEINVELEIAMEKIVRTTEIKDDGDGLRVYQDDEDVSMNFTIATDYIIRMSDAIEKYQESIRDKLSTADPNWQKKIDEVLKKHNIGER